MKIVPPEVNMVTPIATQEWYLQAMELVVAAGKNCYQSAEVNTVAEIERFIKTIIAKGHESVLEHVAITVQIITDRGVSHELVRHRLGAYSQESTRYCNYTKKGMQFINPPCFNLTDKHIERLQTIEDWYEEDIQSGMTPQQSRYFLPNGLKTSVYTTFNLRQWRHVILTRCAPEAHPDIRRIMQMVLTQFRIHVPIFFSDIGFSGAKI